MYLCVKGIEFTPFYDLFYLVLELFRQRGILCFLLVEETGVPGENHRPVAGH
jgi:hypothetical protein